LSRSFIILSGEYCEIGEITAISWITALSKHWERIGMIGRRNLKSPDYFPLWVKGGCGQQADGTPGLPPVSDMGIFQIA
jgi:hypothetical protein